MNIKDDIEVVMPVNLNEAIQKIKKVGPSQVRTVPMPGQDVLTGRYKVEILESGLWSTVVENIPQSTATDLIRQATNRTICG